MEGANHQRGAVGRRNSGMSSRARSSAKPTPAVSPDPRVCGAIVSRAFTGAVTIMLPATLKHSVPSDAAARSVAVPWLPTCMSVSVVTRSLLASTSAIGTADSRKLTACLRDERGGGEVARHMRCGTRRTAAPASHDLELTTCLTHCLPPYSNILLLCCATHGIIVQHTHIRHANTALQVAYGLWCAIPRYSSAPRLCGASLWHGVRTPKLNEGRVWIDCTRVRARPRQAAAGCGRPRQAAAGRGR
eukprot:7341679-Prymnesium_polylepis.2